MVTTAQSTAPRTILMRDGYAIPATADQRTELNDLPICEMMYAKRNGGRVCRATLTAVFEAMRDSSAVVVLYIGADGKQGGAGALARRYHTHQRAAYRHPRLLHDAPAVDVIPPGPDAHLPPAHHAGRYRDHRVAHDFAGGRCVRPPTHLRRQ
jgi:hypothetical protein